MVATLVPSPHGAEGRPDWVLEEMKPTGMLRGAGFPWLLVQGPRVGPQRKALLELTWGVGVLPLRACGPELLPQHPPLWALPSPYQEPPGDTRPLRLISCDFCRTHNTRSRWLHFAERVTAPRKSFSQ